MAKRKTYHVTKTDTGWQGKAEGNQRASVTGETKEKVVKATANSGVSEHPIPV